MANQYTKKSGGGNNKKSREHSSPKEDSEITLPATALPKFDKSFIATMTKKASDVAGEKVSTEAVRDALMQQMANAEYDPIVSLIDKIQHGMPMTILRDGASEIQRIPLDSKEIINIELKLVEYLIPKLKSIESKQEIDLNINVEVTKFGEGDSKKVENIDMTDKAPKVIDVEFEEAG